MRSKTEHYMIDHLVLKSFFQNLSNHSFQSHENKQIVNNAVKMIQCQK